ncbi:MAG: helix-turn-helix transcriptional regulator [Thermotogota bacterium]|jgi:hypothetical protein|nr:helix-turn-helix transcriptional regulator [Thermotogota bacterium]
MYYKLKVKILEKYGTQAAFARECGRNDNWISRIITGRQMPTKEELALISKKIGTENIKNYMGGSNDVIN